MLIRVSLAKPEDKYTSGLSIRESLSTERLVLLGASFCAELIVLVLY